MVDPHQRILLASLLSLGSLNLVHQLRHYLNCQLICCEIATAEYENSFPDEFVQALVLQDAVISSHWIDEPHFSQELPRVIRVVGSAC